MNGLYDMPVIEMGKEEEVSVAPGEQLVYRILVEGLRSPIKMKVACTDELQSKVEVYLCTKSRVPGPANYDFKYSSPSSFPLQAPETEDDKEDVEVRFFAETYWYMNVTSSLGCRVIFQLFDDELVDERAKTKNLIFQRRQTLAGEIGDLWRYFSVADPYYREMLENERRQNVRKAEFEKRNRESLTHMTPA